MAVAFKKKVGTIKTLVVALSGSTVTTDLFDFSTVWSTNQQFFVRTHWVAKDDGDTSKGAMGQRQCVVRESGGTLSINSQNNGETLLTIGAMVTMSYAVSAGKLQMTITNDGSITGEVLLRVYVDY